MIAPTPDQDNATAYARAWFCHGLYGWIEEWFKRGMPETPAEMARLFDLSQQKNI